MGEARYYSVDSTRVVSAASLLSDAEEYITQVIITFVAHLIVLRVCDSSHLDYLQHQCSRTRNHYSIHATGDMSKHCSTIHLGSHRRKCHSQPIVAHYNHTKSPVIAFEILLH